MKRKYTKFFLSIVLLMLCLGFPRLNAAAAELRWPVPGSRNISQGVHDRNAIDISAAAGSEVVAAIGGTVTHKFTCSQQHYGSFGDCHGFGTGLVIRGDDGRTYQYAHMLGSSIPGGVNKGSYVSTGQMIGRVGTTGNSSGPHLHFGICWGNYWEGYGNPLNEDYIPTPTPTPAPAPTPTPNSYYSKLETSAVYDRNAQLYGKIENPGRQKVSQVGVKVWKGSKLVINYVESCGLSTSYVNQTLNINSEAGVYLEHLTAYKYQFCAIVGGKTIYSGTKSFTTTGTHSWKLSSSKDATCTATGSKVYRCSGCSRTKTDTVAAKGHKWSAYKTTKSATCTAKGSKLSRCSRCRKTKTASIAAKGHKWSSWKTTKSATVSRPGTKARTCSVCKKKTTATISKLKPTIKVSAKNVTLKKNQSKTIKVYGLAKGDAVKSWKSSNSKIAAVTSKGKITAKKKGKATITVTLKSGKTAKISVTVK